MRAIEQAIKDSVEKGKYFPNLKSKKWRVTGYSLQCERETGRWPFKWKRWEHVMRTECIFLDPFFWQALGKARGWEDQKVSNLSFIGKTTGKAWKNCWHRFIDHLAEKKDAESFFNEL